MIKEAAKQVGTLLIAMLILWFLLNQVMGYTGCVFY